MNFEDCKKIDKPFYGQGETVDHLVWVTKRIFIHHIARCENSSSRSQHVNAILKSSRGDCDLSSNRFKIYNLYKSFRD
jgi:hypothetical protein